MAAVRQIGVVIASTLVLAACGDVWPTLTGEDPVAARPAGAVGSGSGLPPSSIPMQTASAVPMTGAGSTMQTAVGEKVAAMEGDQRRLEQAIDGLGKRLNALRAENGAAAQRYHAVVAAMNAKLQTGTTPGNPVLVQQWNEAEVLLNTVDGNTGRFNALSNETASEAATAGYLLDSVRATYSLSGAVDEDHRRLRLLEDNVNRSIVVIDRLLTEQSEEINRQTAYVNNERRNMTTLSLAIKNGELYGQNLMNSAYSQAESAARMSNVGGPDMGDRPLVVIRFDRPDVRYETALYNAVGRALERKPNATFNLIAVTPKQGNAAKVALNSSANKRNAEGVLRSLSEMGLPATRISMSANTTADTDANEVHVYVR